MTINWQRFSEVVNNHQSFLLTSHIRPDCDALGSELGMAGILESLGKDVEIVNGQATPPNLAFIDPQKKISVLGEDRTVEDLADVDVLMVLDTSAWIQLGPMGDVVRTTRAKKFILDHPSTKIILSHFGLGLESQVEVFARQRDVYQLAKYDNVYFQASGMHMFCEYPFDSMRELVTQALTSFGP